MARQSCVQDGALMKTMDENNEEETKGTEADNTKT